MTKTEKAFIFVLGLLFVSLLYVAFTRPATAAPFPYAVGGTGSSTVPATGQVFYAGPTAWQSIATSTITAGSGISISGTGYVLNPSGGAFTISASGANTISTTSPISISNLAYFTGVTPTSLGGVATSTLTAGTGLTGSFVQIGSGGSIALSTPVSIANGGTNATSFTTTNNSVYYDGTRLVTSGTSQAVTTPYASTTAVSASGAAYVPALSGCPSSSASGFSSVCLDTTAKQLQVTNGSDLYAYSATSSRGFNIASTSLDAMGKSFNTATSSFLILNSPEPMTLLGFYCVASTTGTALVRLGDGVNWTETSSCSSGGYTVTATNNTFTAFEGLVVQASSTAGAVSRITVTPAWQNTTQ